MPHLNLFADENVEAQMHNLANSTGRIEASIHKQELLTNVVSADCPGI